MEPVIKISVRNIVEFALKCGDIDSGFIGRTTAALGTKGHRTVQKMRSTFYEYLSEVPITHRVNRDGIVLEISGRIDGIYLRDGITVIEEIKTTERQIENIDENYNPFHWAQAKCYAYIYGVQYKLEKIDTQLTYYHRGTKELKSFFKSFTIEELGEFFNEIVSKYLKWANIINKWKIVRNSTIKNLKFPFVKYRKGQREFAVAVYKTISEGKKFFAEAPTGIGKTIGAIFPGVKAVGGNQIAKIFYLTAKTSTRDIAQEAYENLRRQGLRFKTVTITAKEKMCPQDKMSCKPEDCVYAKGYYDRIDDAVEDILNIDNFNRETIVQYSVKHRVCPFEFSLDLSTFCDGIICDYNYVFDPRVYLKRFFTDVREDYGFLIDEGHNLVDRARDMFSTEISKKRFFEIKNEVKNDYPALKKSLNEINSFFIKIRKKCEENNKSYIINKDQLKDISEYLENFISDAEELLSKNGNYSFREKLLELYFEALNYTKTSELYDEKYITYIESVRGDVRIKLFCLDPSRLLNEGMKRAKSSILYSATLSPIEYFINILGGNENDYRIRINSPFDQSNLCLMISDNISTKYANREFSYKNVAQCINSMINIRKGNYIAFFPSYKYLNEVYSVFSQNFSTVETICQSSGMLDVERDEFLKKFSCDNEKTLLGFAVMGGAFGEGIDLTGDRLVGTIIVGVGLPQICIERDIIRDYFSSINNAGFEYAYVYPGMNKVLQAAGRVIRTERDRGIVFLIDERFAASGYRNLLPSAWENINWVRSDKDISSVVEKFWSK